MNGLPIVIAVSPWLAAVTVLAGSPSVSLVKTVPVTALPFSVAVLVSDTATGTRLLLATVSVKVLELLSPSASVKV